MTQYKHNNYRYNCIDISTKNVKWYKVYCTYGKKQLYLHFKGDNYALVKYAADGNEEHRDIIENYFINKLNQL